MAARGLSRWAALFLAVSLAFAAPLRAQTQELNDVRVSVTTVWPTTLAKGYAPIWVALENTAGEERDVELEAVAAQIRGQRKSATNAVRLAPGEERTVELFAPFFSPGGHSYGGYSVLVRIGGDRTVMSTTLSSSGWAEDLRSLVVFTDRAVDAAFALQLSERLKSGDLSTGRRSSFRLTMGGGSSRSAPPTNPNVHATVAELAWMPSRYQAYTSLDAVVVDARSGLPPTNRLAPLLAWARLGGRVVFLGRDVSAELAQLPEVGGWLEERFEIAHGESSGRAFTYGLGVLFTGEMGTGLVESDDSVDLVRAALRPTNLTVRGQSRWVPFPGSWRLKGKTIEIPGLGRVPLRTFMGLLFIFVLAIGPANMYFLKRIGRPALLLVTIPAVSVAFSGALLAYGIFHQGIDVKTASRTMTVLDQRAHRASTVEHRTMFVGLSPAAGLRPAAGTSVFPVKVTTEAERYQVEFGEGVLLRGSYLPVRDPVGQLILTDRSARMRLSVSESEGAIEVQNSFEHAIRWLLVSDAEGRWHSFDGPIEPGASARLAPVAEPVATEAGPPAPAGVPAVDWVQSDDPRLHTLLRRHDSSLLFNRVVPPASYIAVIERNPFTDDCGIEVSRLDERHVIVGVLPESVEDWE